MNVSPAPVLRLLGTVEVHRPGRGPVVLGGHPATMLSLLGTEPGRVVSFDRLMHEIWGEEPPASGRSSMYAQISRLRRTLADSGLAIVARTQGYLLDGPAELVDTRVLAALVEDSAAAASTEDWATSLGLAERATGLWRGDPFTEAVIADDLGTEARRLRRLVERARELTARAQLALGRADEAARGARDLTDADPFNEAYWQLRIRAEQRSAGTAVALASHQAYRELLDEELGIDPSERMRSLHLELLREPAAGPAAPTPPPVGPAPDRALVGRRNERRVLEAAVEAALAGRGRLVVLEGEAGIGKTRLAEHAADVAARRGARVVWARAIEGAGTPPLWLWEQVLRELGTGLPAAPESLAPEQARFRLHQAIAERVLDPGPDPLLLILDDLQWADAGSLQVLRLVAEGLRQRRLGIVVTSRPRTTHLVDPIATLQRDASVDRLRLDAFTPTDVRDLVADHADRGGPTDPHDLAAVDALWQRSGGNPFFLTEILRDPDDGRVPVSVSELVGLRLRDLPDASRRLLDAAALIGRRVDPLLIAQVAGLPVVEAVRLLEPLIAEGLVANDVSTRSLTFVHDLAREAIATRIPLSRTLELHGAIADALERVYAEERTEHLDEIAGHRFEAAAGAPSEPAYLACLAAADHAAERLSYDQAALQRARALATLAPGAETRPRRFELLLALTRERRLAGDVLAASTSLGQALELARTLDQPDLTRRALVVLGEPTLWNWRQLGEVDRVSVAALEKALADEQLDPVDRAGLTGALAVEVYYDGDVARGRELAAAAVATARTVDDPVLLGRVLNNQVVATWYPGEDPARHAALDEAIGLADRGLPQTTEAIARLHRAPLRLQEADVDGFVADLSRADWLAERLGRPELQGQVSSEWTGLALLRGERAATLEAVDRTHDLMSRTSLWGAEWIRLVPVAALARIDGTLDRVADQLVARASEEANRMLRWTAVHSLALLGATADARALQVRWGLTTMPDRPHWGSPIEWTQAAEVALELGSPAPVEAYDGLRRIGFPLVLVGSALTVWGPVDALRARLADHLGDPAAAERHRAGSAAVTARVEASLGVPPTWPLG